MKELIDKALQAGCSEAETFLITKETQGLFFVNNKISDLQSKESTGVALRIKKDDRLGFVGSSNLKNISEIVAKAIASTKYSEDMSYSLVPPSQYPQLDNIYNTKLAGQPIADYIPRSEQFIQIILDVTQNIKVDCSFEKTVTTIQLHNSLGLDTQFKSSLLTFYTEMRLTEADTSLEIEMQYDTHDETVDEVAYATSLAKEIPYLFKRRSIQSGKRKVIFTPDCFGDLFMSLEAGLRGSSVAKGISPLKDKMGQQIFDERVTIIDDSTDPQGKLAALFDDEGTPGQKTDLVRGGVLQNYICDMKAASDLNRAPTGNGLRSKGIYRVKSYTVKPICDFSNVTVQAGSMSLAEMIESIDEGVLVQSIGGLLLANLTNGDYSGTIGQGLKIESGKIVGRVTNAMISGNFYRDFLHNLVDFSRETSCQGAFSGQIGSFNMPYAYLRDITISSR